jgi:hypothetical protein
MTAPSAARRRNTDRRHRTKRSWPICEATGKQRFGERKDAKLALRAAYYIRASANLIGEQSSWTVCREYQCDFCDGWHLTSQPSARQLVELPNQSAASLWREGAA